MNKKKELDKNKMQEAVRKAIKTTMIGSIDKVEQKLGFLWTSKDNQPLTENQQRFLDIFTDLRKLILDNGNTQSRAICSYMDKFEIEEVGYSINLLPVVRKEGK